MIADNFSPLPADVAHVLARAFHAIPSRAKTPWQPMPDEWWSAVLADPRLRPRKPTHPSMMLLREHRGETIVLSCDLCGFYERTFSTAEAMTLFGGHQTMVGLRPMLLSCRKRRCEARYVG
jgi:hypothetical protein